MTLEVICTLDLNGLTGTSSLTFDLFQAHIVWDKEVKVNHANFHGI